MPNDMYKRYKLTIFPATFVHIGNGEQLDPTQYVIQQNTMYVLNQSNFIARLLIRDPKGLNDALQLKRGTLARYWYERFNPDESDTWFQKYPVDKSLQESYLNKLDKVEAQQLVNAFITNPLSGNPIIPGSSIKGAIRTAILYEQLKKSPKDKLGKPQNIEPTVFNYMGSYNPDVTLDPFKYLKIADAETSSDNLVLKQVQNLKKDDKIFRKHTAESLAYLCQALNKGTKNIYTTLSIHKNWKVTNGVEDIIAICNGFFKDKLKSDEPYYRLRNKDLHAFLVSTVDKLPKNSCFIRLGKGTGCIHKSTEAHNPQTRNLIGKMAMGICQLTFKELA